MSRAIPTGIGAGGAQAVALADGPSLDAFSRLRVSDAHLLLSGIHDHNKRPDLYDEVVTNAVAASSTFDADRRSVALAVGGDGDSVVRQTWVYFPYRAAQSQLVILTFVLGAGVASTVKRVGYFDADNGLFLEQNGASGLRIVRRSSVTGSPVDTAIEQASWNKDRLDGTGPSGITLDPTKTQILVIDLQWLGVGRVRVGFDLDGVIVYVHEFVHANSLDAVYMTQANLPVRYEVASTGGVTSLEQICSAVVREGGDTEPAIQRGIDLGIAAYNATTTLTTLLGVRIDPNNPRTLIGVLGQHLLNLGATNPVRWVLCVDPTYTGTPTWVDLDPGDALVEASLSNLPVTNVGRVAASGYVAAAAGGRGVTSAEDLANSVLLGAAIDGTPQEAWLCVQTTASTSDVLAGFDIREFR